MDGTSTFPWNFIISQLHPLSREEVWERNETDMLHKKKKKMKTDEPDSDFFSTLSH